MIANPSTNSTPRQDLYGAYMAWSPNESFISRTVLPPRPSMALNGIFGYIGPKESLQRLDTKMALRAPMSTSDIVVGSDTFSIDQYGTKFLCTAAEGRQYRNWFDFEAIGAQMVRRRLAIDEEYVVAAACQNTTTFATADVNTGSVTAWTTAGSADGIADIVTACRKVQANRGVVPTRAVITFNQQVWLSAQTAVQGRLALATSGAYKPGVVSLDVLASLTGIPGFQFVYANSFYDAANPGSTTVTATSIWSDTKVIIYAPNTGDPTAASLGSLFVPDDFQDVRLRSWASEDPEGIWIAADTWFGAKINTTAPAYLLTGVSS